MNTVDADQTLRSMASDLGLQCLPMFFLWNARINWSMKRSNLGFGRLSSCLFVLRFYGPVNPLGSCQAQSVYLTTRLLGRLSPPID